MRFKKLTIIVMFLLVISILSAPNINSYAGVDDLIALGVGCVAGGFWSAMWGGGECGPYVPPAKGNCEKCGENPLQECSEYQCMAIGVNCKWDNGQCLDFTKGDTSSPMITNCEKISRYSEYIDQRQAVYSQQVCNFGEIVKGKGVVAVLTTDEFAKCRFDVEQFKGYENMRGVFEISDDFSTKHILTINPGENATEEAMKKCENSNCRLFVRCADVAGNEMKYDYAFIFEIKGAGEDMTPPKIEFSSVESGYVMKFHDTSLDFGLIADDPESGVTGCKYSKEDKEYDLMENELNCDGDRPTACTTTLTNIKDGQENKFYFRCKDKKGNADNIGKELIINGGALLGMQISISEPVTRTSKLSVITSGGSDDNSAYCFYKCELCDIKDYVLFDNTGGNNHEQELNFIPKPGNYDVKIGCGDSAGDIVEETKSLVVGALTLNAKLLETKIDKQKASITVQTSDGEKSGEAECNLFKDNNINHKYGDLNSVGLKNLDGNKHSVEISDLKNGHYDWIVVCRDLIENQNYALVSFDINTPDLGMQINPGTGTLDALNVRVTITTTNGINNGASICKIKTPEAGFVDNDQFEEVNIENGKKANVHIIDLPSSNGKFGQAINTYYIVCRDDAGKTNGQIVNYNINLGKYDLVFSDFKLDNKAELKTDRINPILSFATTGGENGDGVVDCDVECDLNGEKIYGSSTNTNNHVIKFSNLKDGSYNCKISCMDPNFVERGTQEVSKSFIVETPALIMSLVDYPSKAGRAKIKLQTSGGIGKPSCYYANHYSADFEEKGYFDITNAKSWVDKANGIPNVWMASGIYNHLSVNINFKTGETYFMQCKDNVGKLSNYEKFSIS